MVTRTITLPLFYDDALGGYAYQTPSEYPEVPQNATFSDTKYYLQLQDDITDSAITATSIAMGAMLQAMGETITNDVFTIKSFTGNIATLTLTHDAWMCGYGTKIYDFGSTDITFKVPTGQTPVNFIVEQIYQQNPQIVYTSTQYYASIATALRNILSTDKLYYPSEMAPAISKIVTLDTYASAPFFSTLTQALSYYNGQYGDALFYSNTYPNIRGTAGFTSTNAMSGAVYEYITADTTGASYVNLTHNYYGAIVDYSYAAGLAIVNPRLAMFPNATVVNSRSSTYNGSTASLYQLSCDNVTAISVYAFQSFANLTSISFPACTVVSTCGFRYVKTLTDVTMPNLITIGNAAFQNTNISNALFLKCTKIGNYAFYVCSNLQTVSVSTANIYSHTFQNCHALKSIYFGGTSVYGSTTYNANYAFANCPVLQTIQAPNLTSISNPYFQFFISGQNSASIYSTCALRNLYFDALSTGSNAGFSCFKIITNNRISKEYSNPTITLGIDHLSANITTTYLAYNSTTQVISSYFDNIITSWISDNSDWYTTTSKGYWGPSCSQLLWNWVPYSYEYGQKTSYEQVEKYGAIIDLPNVTTLISCTKQHEITQLYETINPNIPATIYYFKQTYKEDTTQIYWTTLHANPMIKQLNLPNVSTVPYLAFQYAKFMNLLTLQNCTSIQQDAFLNAQIYEIRCPNLSELTYETFGRCSLSIIAFDDLPLISSIAQHSIGTVSDLTRFEMSTLQYIAPYGLFVNPSKLNTIYLPKIQKLQHFAFSNGYFGAGQNYLNSQYCDIQIGPQVRLIASYAFAGIAGRAKFSIDSNNYYFVSNNNIYSYFHSSVPLIYGSISQIEYINLYTSFNTGAFCGQLKIQKATFPNLNTIIDYMFCGCHNLKQLIAENVTDISNYAFCYCSNLTTIDFPQVTTIQYGAFMECNNLKTINCPKLTTLGSFAFKQSTQYFGTYTTVDDIQIPNVTTIFNNAFVRIKYDKPLYLYNLQTISSAAFYSFSASAIYLNNTKMVQVDKAIASMYTYYDVKSFYIPESLLADYQACTYWSNIISRFVTY